MELSKQGQPTALTGLVSQRLPINAHPPRVPLLPMLHSNFSGNWGLSHLLTADNSLLYDGIEAPIPLNSRPYPLRAMNTQSVQMEASCVGAPFRSENIQTSMPVFLPSKTLPSTNKRLLSMGAPSKPQVGKGVSPSSNKRPAQTEPPPKIQSESFETVRSKMRESLASSLTLVTDQQSQLQIIEKSSFGESPSAERQVDAVSNEQGHECQGVEKLTSNLFLSEESRKDSIPCANDMQEFQSKHVSSKDDITNGSAAVEDELLQGHGLCWVSDHIAGASDAIALHDTKRIKIALEETTGEVKEMTQKAESLAFRIEAELFRLFGGVNKKYKEKGRSLLFNLKDRSNPELRERVLSGDIAPERLCRMSAEELASKELSQWRLAKAEELAQMVVLPDTEVDIRRLIKKTHKGEFQVEVEESDAPSVEVELQATVLSRVPLKSNEELQTLDGMMETEKAEAGNDNFSSSLETLVNEKTDPMQEMMVDELKDAEHLTPVFSLDEFMQALDSEPPFGKLSSDALQDVQSSGGKSCEPRRDATSDSLGPNLFPLASGVRSHLDSLEDGSSSVLDSLLGRSEKKSDHADTTPEDPAIKSIPDNVNDKNSNTSNTVKSNSADFQPVGTLPRVPSTNESIWEGAIQLNVSSLANVIAIFRSGEKPATNEWPSFVEIKGRVRLDAFEKFLHELPLSRSRVIMIAQFCWKEGSPECGLLNMTEMIDSYVADERVGFAEPAPGVELYLCPPHAKTVEMLVRLLTPEHQPETLLRSVNDLIGVVVWRRPHVTATISPRISLHKNTSTKKESISRLSSMSASRSAVPPKPSDDDDTIDNDDVPPGFGPLVARDEDDLPEFDFVTTLKSLAPGRGCQGLTLVSSRPVGQMRELIHKYGQGEGPRSDLECLPWNDDADDIPEWNPCQDKRVKVQAPLPPPPPQPASQLFSYNQLHNAPPEFHRPPLMPLPQMGVVPGPFRVQQLGWPPNPCWPLGPGQGDLGSPMVGLPPPSHFARVSGIGQQVYGVPCAGASSPGMGWRPDVPGSRGAF